MRGVNVYRRPQHIKLSTLLDFYEADPEARYRIFVQNGVIRTAIEQNYDQGISEQSYGSDQVDSFADANQIDRMAERTVGLFANLIKNLDKNKHKPEPPKQIQPVNEKPPRRQYQFYFNNLKTKDNEFFKPEIGTATRRVKQRATGICQNIGRFQRRANENWNEMNGQVEAIHISDREEHTKEMDKLDFSFEEMNNLQQQKRGRVEQIHQSAQHNIQIKIIEPPKHQGQFGNESNQKQGSKHQIRQITFPENNVPVSFFSQEVKNQQFQPIPHRSRHEIKTNEQKKADFLSMNVQSQTSIVEGARKAESRIFNNSSKGLPDQKDVQIDFDLDLNFI